MEKEKYISKPGEKKGVLPLCNFKASVLVLSAKKLQLLDVSFL